jgi:predicted regulator of Ras-like GTPase activity (Roadblock/LC7/MglB family)
LTGQTQASPFGAGLASLFDLEGVYGSFLVTTAGDVVARALPEIVDDATLFEVGGRVIRLADTFATVGISPELCVLRFAEHKLYIKNIVSGALCILTGSEVNLPALRMAANVVARRVGPELARALAGSTDAVTPPLVPREAFAPRRSSSAMAVTTGASSSAPAPPIGPRLYRGRPIG